MGAPGKSVTVYGIPNCDTVKKARAWLDERGIAYTFHDYKKAGADAKKLAAWSKASGWEALINRSGTTYKKIPEHVKSNLDSEKAIALLIANPSAIRRPIVEHASGFLIGFKPEEWAASLDA